jgi:exodeoxyribonuclease V alpha subunit
MATTQINATVFGIRGRFGDALVFYANTDRGKRVRMVARGERDSAIEEGQYRGFEGRWEDYKAAGKQFAVEDSWIAAVTDAAVESFLLNQNGLGSRTVQKLIKAFGPRLPQLLDSGDVEALSTVDGVGEVTAMQAVQSWQEQGAREELFEFLKGPLESNKPLIQKLTKPIIEAHKFYSQNTLDKLKDNPYLLWAFCPWDATDLLAGALGVPRDDRRRLVCAVEEALYRLYNKGHTAPLPALVDAELKSILDGEWKSCLAIYEAAREDGLHTRRFFIRDNGGWSLPAAFHMERYVEQELLRRAADQGHGMVQLPLLDAVDTSHYLLPSGHPLDREQEQAVQSILRESIVAVIGAAGTGKTSVLHAANEFLHHSGRHVLQVALSGKAAQRLKQQTGQEAFTIEALLAKAAASPGMLDRFDLPVLFIDEASMVDLPLMYRTLKLFENRPVKIVFIGDWGQLPPIGPGLVFQRIIKSGAFHVVELKTNYRSLAGSTIPEVAQIIRDGGTFKTSPDVLHLLGDRDIADQALDRYLANQDLETVQIISATQRVMARANRRLQAQLLAHAPVVPKAPEFRIGDKVIYKRNDRALGLVNGSMGVIVEPMGDRVVTNEELGETVEADLVIKFANEGRVPLLLGHVKSFHDGEWYLQHAYALTNHQAQGSEFDCVIIALERSQVLDRSWLYTAITRAKRKVVFVGDQALIQEAIDAGNKADQRCVGLSFGRIDDGY